MSLMECSDCGKNVSALATACPNCGYPVAEEEEKAAAEKEVAKKRGMKGFVEFIRKQGVVGLAVRFIIGLATAGVVTAMVNDLINPIIGAILGEGSLDTIKFHIGDAVFNYGHFIGVLINFVIILAVVYLLFKVLRLDKLDIEKAGTEVSQSTKDKTRGSIFLAISCFLLLIVPVLAKPEGHGLLYGILGGIIGILVIAFLISGLFYLIRGLSKKG